MALANDHSEERFTPLYPAEETMVERVPANELVESDLRQFYDPTDRHKQLPTNRFIDWVASTRRPETVIGIGRATAHEVILAEATHAFMPRANRGPGVALPIPERRQVEVAQGIRAHAGKIALSVLDTTENIAEERKAKQKAVPEVKLQELPSRLLLSGKVLAAVAHEHMRRRSGRAYYMHPDEVSSIISVAWRRQKYPEEPLLDVVRFLAYAHDAYEDTIDPFGNYLKKPLIVTPLVANSVLRVQMVSQADAAARTLLNMARTRDVDGNRMEYTDYVQRGIRESGALYILTKAPDIQHNLSIEPEKIMPGDEKTWHKYKKRQSYKDAAIMLLKAADAEDYAFVVHSVFGVTPEEVHRVRPEKYSLDLGRLVSLVQSNLRARGGDLQSYK